MVNTEILDYLNQLDLPEIEAKIYLTSLKTGPISVRELAKQIDVKRTTLYFYIDKLIENGLLIKIVKGSRKLVAASQPEEALHNLVEERVKSAKNVQTNFSSILSKINNTYPLHKEVGEAEIKYYKGKSGVKKIYEEALKAMELRVYVKVETTNGLFSNNVDLFTRALQRNPLLTVKEIIYDSPLATKDAQQIKLKNKNYFYKLMPKELQLTSGDILMYDENVAIINYDKLSSCVVLKSADYYNNSKELFDFIWRTIL